MGIFSRISYRIADINHFLQKLTLTKITNFLMVLVSFYISRIRRKSTMPGLPVAVSVEPTTSCNLRCPHCVSGLRSFTRPTGMMETDLFNRVVGQLKKELISMTLYFQGEPFLNPGFYEMVAQAGRNKVYTVTSTNGHYLSEENAEKVIKSGLNRIIISVDNFEQEPYAAYRVGGNIETVRTGIRHLVQQRKKLGATNPLIILQFLVNKFNEDKIGRMRSESYRLGADKAVFKTMQIYDYEEGSPFIPESAKYSRYVKDQQNRFSIKNKLFNHCWKMWHSCVITWDGKVLPCCFDKDGSHSLGTLNGVSMEGIWRSDSYQSFRNLILDDRKGIDICTNCSEGTKVWL